MECTRPFLVASAAIVLATLAAGLVGCGSSAPSGPQPTAGETAPPGRTSLGLPTPTAAELARMRNYIDHFYDRSAVAHSFQSALGGMTDCVPIDKQPAVVAGRLGNRPIARPPSFAPPTRGGRPLIGSEAYLTGERDPDGQTRACPDGTIPILRPQIDLMSKFDTLEHYFSKGRGRPYTLPGCADTTSCPATNNWNDLAGCYNHVIGYENGFNKNLQGGNSTLSVDDPYVQNVMSGEHSLSEMWIVGGSCGSGNVQVVEGGWNVDPALYGSLGHLDYRARLFIYTTLDGYGTGGTGSGADPQGGYNLDGGYFVQTNTRWTLGGALADKLQGVPDCSPQGCQEGAGASTQEITIGYATDDVGNWWFSINEIWVGYYPNSLYAWDGLATGADEIEVGGEVFDRHWGGHHTATLMGTGTFGSKYYATAPTGAAYHRNVQWLDNTWAASDALLAYQINVPGESDPASCYDYADTEPAYVNSDWGTHFSYGGPGTNFDCP